jgi:uncharacterized protein (TIGR02246 family)
MTGIHKFIALAGAAAIALGATGCNKVAGAGASDTGAVKSAITADQKKWNDQFKSKDLEGLLSHYADDAFFVAPGVPAADGATAIRKAYAEGLNDKNFNVDIASDKTDVAASGDLAYVRGHFSEKYTDPKTDQVMSHTGLYLTVYKKQADGSWKAVEDFAAAEPGSEKPVAPGPVAKPAKMISM